jgi:predicted 3-demethylubiquinone-9 3-methyltransferase (glyoxalase superfamily)
MKTSSASITPFLWFDGQLADAIKFYRGIFKQSKLLNVSRNGKHVQSATLRLAGQTLILFNGGPHYKLTPAVSLMIRCKTQRAVDYYWEKLTRGGTESRCGWLVDRFGLSWQVVPDLLFDLLNDDDEAKSGRAMQAMMQMRKLDVTKLKRAHGGS